MATQQWKLDALHSDLGFKIRHLMITNVTGYFRDFDVTMQTEGDDLTTARIEARIRIASIDTGNAQRDEHLRNSDFFDAPQFPEMVYTSTSVESKGDDRYLVHGNLTMKGQTHPLTFQVNYNGSQKDHFGNAKAGFEVTGKLNRVLWGVNFNAVLETGGVALSEEVKFNSELQLVRETVLEAVEGSAA